VKAGLRSLVEGRDLPSAEMESIIGTIVDGGATDAQIGAFLAALAAKGESVDEIVATATVMRSRALRVRVEGSLVDLCGTGGDGLGTFNVSTAASFVAAAAGARIAKHGNRAASGNVGAADVLEALGAKLELSPELAAEAVRRLGFVFLFAPAFHPAMRNVAKPRREIGIRTVFNLTGPLCNPAGARRQVLGVFAPRWLAPMANALVRLGCEHALVVHGGDGSDEITPTAPTRAIEVRDGSTRAFDIDPSELGIAASSVRDLAGGSASDNAARLRAVLGGERGPCADATALNAGAALYVAGIRESFSDGVATAQAVLAGRKALSLLESYVELTQQSGR
jgi:anthranilate phosphoribosyltransferase